MTLTDVSTTRAEVIFLTLKMTSARVVKTSVKVTSNSPSQDCTHPDDHNLPTYDMTPGFKPFTTYNGCKVEKLDCVGHLQKRMGKRLMNLKATTKGKLADGKPIGGQGRLSESRIKRLQKYYGLAIRQNTLSKANPTEREVNVAVYTMKKNIIAILHHCIHLPDPNKQHRFCPVGESSWCKWQQDSASGTATYKADDCLPEVFFDLLQPIFMTLSETKLLERCVRGATQNRNECINSMVWVRYTMASRQFDVQWPLLSAIFTVELPVEQGSCRDSLFQLEATQRKLPRKRTRGGLQSLTYRHPRKKGSADRECSCYGLAEKRP